MRGNLIKKGEILTESMGFNFETECREEAGDDNELTHDKYGFVCDVGSYLVKHCTEKI